MCDTTRPNESVARQLRADEQLSAKRATARLGSGRWTETTTTIVSMGSAAGDVSGDEEVALLERLNAYGQEFMRSFAPVREPPMKRRKLSVGSMESSEGSRSDSSDEGDGGETWVGFGEYNILSGNNNAEADGDFGDGGWFQRHLIFKV